VLRQREVLLRRWQVTLNLAPLPEKAKVLLKETSAQMRAAQRVKDLPTSKVMPFGSWQATLLERHNTQSIKQLWR
jgi:hypothetical protein